MGPSWWSLPGLLYFLVVPWSFVVVPPWPFLAVPPWPFVVVPLWSFLMVPPWPFLMVPSWLFPVTIPFPLSLFFIIYHVITYVFKYK
ncbi:hypothetical protein EV424DRAFT_1423614 [Suillus variegatus]|nr:hypothetical protein EV424DRAFT_1423614 [Suillus variegatus]